MTSLLAVVAEVAAGIAAGTINTVVGSGSLITFPTLLALGVPPITANVSNTVGLVPGGLSGALGYRRELTGQSGRLYWLAPAAAVGGLAGGILLLELPGSAFKRVVPELLLAAVALVLAQPWLATRLARYRGRAREVSPALLLAVTVVGIYGGYFGAAQGFMLIALMGMFLSDSLQRINAAKNVLAMLVNAVAALLFVAVAPVDWAVVGAIAAGSVLGGQLGARVGRRFPPRVLRGIVVVFGTAVALNMLV